MLVVVVTLSACWLLDKTTRKMMREVVGLGLMGLFLLAALFLVLRKFQIKRVEEKEKKLEKRGKNASPYKNN